MFVHLNNVHKNKEMKPRYYPCLHDEQPRLWPHRFCRLSMSRINMRGASESSFNLTYPNRDHRWRKRKKCGNKTERTGKEKKKKTQGGNYGAMTLVSVHSTIIVLFWPAHKDRLCMILIWMHSILRYERRIGDSASGSSRCPPAWKGFSSPDLDDMLRGAQIWLSRPKTATGKWRCPLGKLAVLWKSACSSNLIPTGACTR